MAMRVLMTKQPMGPAPFAVKWHRRVRGSQRAARGSRKGEEDGEPELTENQSRIPLLHPALLNGMHSDRKRFDHRSILHYRNNKKRGQLSSPVSQPSTEAPLTRNPLGQFMQVPFIRRDVLCQSSSISGETDEAERGTGVVIPVLTGVTSLAGDDGLDDDSVAYFPVAFEGAGGAELGDGARELWE